MRAARFAVLAGGGTAGHVLTALAVGEALVERGHARSSILFVGSERGLESSIVPRAGIELVLLPGRGLLRKLSLQNVLAVIGLSWAVARAVGVLRRSRPQIVVSVGGYAAFPCALAAVLLGVPLVQVNVDAVPGAVNRMLGRFARASAIAFEGTELPRAVVTGVPVRREVLAARHDAKHVHSVRRELGIPDPRKMVLAFGGSLGSRTINEAVSGLARRWLDRADVAIIHVVGRRDWRYMRAGLPEGRETGLFYRAVEYEERLPMAMAVSDLVICRSGAISVAEIAVLGVPSLLVPLPGAPGDHQHANAMALHEAGAAVVLPDGECDEASLATLAGELLGDAAKLRAMREASRSVGHPDAASRVAILVDLHARGAEE